MNVIDVDKIIVTKNIERFEESGKIDISYLDRLSYSGVIGLVDLYEKNETIPGLKGLLQKRKGELLNTTITWQSYNLKREQAKAALRDVEYLSNKASK